MTTNVAPFTVQERLTQIALSTKPTGMIADLVCPRISVPGKKFAYTVLTTAEAFTIPNTLVGRTSKPAEVEFGGTDVTNSCDDYGLDDFVPQEDIDLAVGGNYDPLGLATEMTAMLLELAREKRVADLYFTKANYAGTLSTTLSGNTQWSHADANPVEAIMNALDLPLVRPNIAVLGRATWSVLRRNSKVVAAVMGKKATAAATAAAGVLAREAVADLFELDMIHIGEPFVNVSKPGQTASYARLWGKHAAFLRIDPAVRSARASLPTFAFTAEWGSRLATTIPDATRGLKGGTIVRVGEQVKELICAQDVGYFFEDAVA